MTDPASELFRINAEFESTKKSQENVFALKKQLYKWNTDYCEFRASTTQELEEKEAKIPLFIYKTLTESWIVLSKLAYLTPGNEITIVLIPIYDIQGESPGPPKMSDHSLEFTLFEKIIPTKGLDSIFSSAIQTSVKLDKLKVNEIIKKILNTSFQTYVGDSTFTVNDPVYVGDSSDKVISSKVIAPNYSLLGVIDETVLKNDVTFKIRVFMRGGLPSKDTLIVPFWAHDQIFVRTVGFKSLANANPEQWTNVENSIKRLQTFYFDVFGEQGNIEIKAFTKIEIVGDKLQLNATTSISLNPNITKIKAFPFQRIRNPADESREAFLLVSKYSYIYGYGSEDTLETITKLKDSMKQHQTSVVGSVVESAIVNLITRIDYTINIGGPVIEPVIEPEEEEPEEKEKPEKKTTKELKEELKTLQEEITELTKKNKNLQDDLLFTKVGIVQLKKNNKNLNSEIQKKDKKIKDLEQLLEAKPEIPPAEAKQEKIAEIKRKLEKAKQELRRLNQEAYELKEARKDPKRKEKGELNLQTQIKIKLNDIGRLNYILLQLTDSKKLLALPKTEIKSIETVIKQLSKNETIMKLNQLKQNLKSLNEKAFQQKRIDPDITTEEGTMFQSRIQTTIEEIEKLNKHLIKLKKK